MSDDAIPEPDRIEGAPHPRETLHLYGQAAAEAAFLDAYTHGRLHHGWLLCGPRGVGKATLGWRIARFLLATPPVDDGLFGAPPPPQTLDISADDPVARRILARSEPRLFHLRRAWDEDKKRLKSVITVDEVRRLKSFFALSAADGGRRVAIVDCADEMNPSAANALLKILEEPPVNVTLLLISHQPSGLLPTIRSRCRILRLGTLGAADVTAAMAGAMAAVGAGAQSDDPAALAILSAGSVGEAIRLANLDGLATYRALITLFAGLPGLDRTRAIALADATAGRGAEPRFDLTVTLLDLFLSRLARGGVSGPAALTEAAPGEAALIARLCPDAPAARGWAEVQQMLGARARAGRAVNLDPAALILDMVLKVNAAAERLCAR